MKTVLLETNFNGKLTNTCFIHIAPAPEDPIPESKFPVDVIIKTKDNSVPEFTAQLINIYRVPFNELATLETWQSHGVDTFVFAGGFMPDFKAKNPAMCVYFYRRVL